MPGLPGILERGSECAGLPVAQCTSTRRRITFSTRSARVGGKSTPELVARVGGKSRRHLSCDDLANISNIPFSFLDRSTACTPGRECTGAARSVVESSAFPCPTTLRAFVFFLSHRPPLFGTSINVCVFYLFILWGSPHSNSTLCQFRGGGCPYNKLKPRDDDVD